MAYTEYHPEESEEDGDQDQFDLGSSFDDLEPGYFENQTHWPADIHAKNEAEYDEQYEEEFGSDEDWYEDSDDELKIDPNNEWSEAIKELRLCKEKLDWITKEKQVDFRKYKDAKSQLFRLLDFNNTYTTYKLSIREA